MLLTGVTVGVVGSVLGVLGGLGLSAARQYFDELVRLQSELGLEGRPTLDHLLALGVFAEEPPEEDCPWRHNVRDKSGKLLPRG